MNRIAEVFGAAPVLLPVVHPISREKALDAVRVAHAAGLRGVFLIDQGIRESAVLGLVREVRERYPALWIGVNLLGRAPANALALALDACGTIDGLWTDKAGVDEHGCERSARDFLVARERAGWKGLYFGGVAFKYQREIAQDCLGRAAANAASYMDVVCTSGPGTGYAADVSKVQALRAGLDDNHALALASGITPENVQSYMPYAQAFLVGTSLERRFGELDPSKISALLGAMQKAGCASQTEAQ